MFQRKRQRKKVKSILEKYDFVRIERFGGDYVYYRVNGIHKSENIYLFDDDHKIYKNLYFRLDEKYKLPLVRMTDSSLKIGDIQTMRHFSDVITVYSNGEFMFGFKYYGLNIEIEPLTGKENENYQLILSKILDDVNEMYIIPEIQKKTDKIEQFFEQYK